MRTDVAPTEAITRWTAMADLPEFLHVGEAAVYLDVHRSVVYDAVRRGMLASIRVGRLIRIPREALAVLVDRDVMRASDP